MSTLFIIGVGGIPALSWDLFPPTPPYFFIFILHRMHLTYLINQVEPWLSPRSRLPSETRPQGRDPKFAEITSIFKEPLGVESLEDPLEFGDVALPSTDFVLFTKPSALPLQGWISGLVRTYHEQVN